jgi:hypothetical protein
MATDAEEDARYGPDRRGDEPPPELARRETRLQRIREAKRCQDTNDKQQMKPVVEAIGEQAGQKPQEFRATAGTAPRRI